MSYPSLGFFSWRFWLTAGLFLLLALWAPPAMQRLDLLAFDLLSPPRAAIDEAPLAALVVIDERSLARYGKWPWPRERFADLVDTLVVNGSGPIAFAIAFDSRDPANPSGDLAFAAALKRGPSILMPVIPAQRPDGFGILALRVWEGFRETAIEGHADVEIDIDGLSRRVFLFAGVDGRHWPVLSGAALRASGVSHPPLLEEVSGDDPDHGAGAWQRSRELLIRHTWRRTVPAHSFVDVLEDRVAPEALRGKVIFVGAAASGLNPVLNIPGGIDGGQAISTVEYHARLFEALRRGETVVPVSLAISLALGTLLLFAAVPLARRYRLLLPVLPALPPLVSLGMLKGMALWFAPVPLSLALLLLVLVCAWERFRQLESRERIIRHRSLIAMESIADGILVIDAEGRIEQANSVAGELIGQAPGKLQGQTCREVFGENSPLCEQLARCLREQIRIEHDEPLRLDAPSRRIVRISIGPVSEGSRTNRGAVLVLSDISQLILAEERLQHQATHDPLTGLPNRALIHDRLSQILASINRSGHRAAVLFLDLDRFKHINDGAGHQVGDQVLRVISQRFRACCRQEDTVGRWGGDEFVIVLFGNGSADHCQSIAKKLISEARQTIEVGDAAYHLGVSIGIALAPDDGLIPDKLLNLADMAMYHAKSAGGNRFAFASQELNRSSVERLAVESGLRQALDEGRFEVHYQPQIEMKNHRLIGLEALVRWRQPDGLLASPEQFIGVAEDSGLIVEIGIWVIERVAAQIREWLDDGLPEIPVAINVSARQCQDLSLVEAIQSALERHCIAPELIEIEITETAAVHNLDLMRRLLDQLDHLGIRVAIDDFGTGYSSLAHLKCLPISVLKIDKSFINGTPDNLENRSISKATIALAHSLGLKVVAEGVEEGAQLAFLKDENCDVAQGFLFSKPLAAEEATALLASRRCVDKSGGPASKGGGPGS